MNALHIAQPYFSIEKQLKLHYIETLFSHFQTASNPAAGRLKNAERRTHNNSKYSGTARL